MFNQATITKNIAPPHYVPPTCLQQQWYPKQESGCFTAAWREYDKAEPWSDPELLGLDLNSSKETQIPWTSGAKAQGRAFAWLYPKTEYI